MKRARAEWSTMNRALCRMLSTSGHHHQHHHSSSNRSCRNSCRRQQQQRYMMHHAVGFGSAASNGFSCSVRNHWCNASLYRPIGVYRMRYILKISHLYPRRRQWRGRVFTSVCLCVCLFFPHDVSKTDSVSIAKFDVEMFNYESWKPIYFEIKRLKVKVTSHKIIASVGLCTLVSAGFF